MLKKFTFLAIAASLFIACGDDSSSSPNTEESLNNSEASSSSVSATGASDSSTVDTTSSESSDTSNGSATSSESSASETSGNSSSSLVAFSSSSTTATSSSGINAESSSSGIVDTSSSSVTSATSSSSTEDSSWRTYCLDVINKYRATENLKPLTLAPEAKQTCADEEAAADLEANKAHGHFGDCGESAQNSGPNVDLKWRDTEEKIIDTYLDMMWDEKKLVESGDRDPAKNEDYPYIGHYLNMRNANYTTVACGIAKNSDGTKGWFNVDFF